MSKRAQQLNRDALEIMASVLCHAGELNEVMAKLNDYSNEELEAFIESRVGVSPLPDCLNDTILPESMKTASVVGQQPTQPAQKEARHAIKLAH